MLTTFPNLLVYGFYAPTILRIAAACVLFYLAAAHYKDKEQIARTGFPIVGKGAWIPWVAVIIEFIAALGLLLGYHTQFSAIIGAAIGLKYSYWSGKYPHFFLLSRTEGLLLMAICLSLIISSAGALAFDLPL